MSERNHSIRLGLALAGLALFGVSVDDAHAQPGGSTLVATEAVREMTFHRELNLIGRTQARAESRIVAQVSGVVESIGAREGRAVARGDVLVKIHPDRLRLTHEARVAEAAQAAAEAERAERELVRIQELFEQSVVPEHNLDVARAEATRSRERVAQLEAEVAQHALDLRNCTIRAPFGGFTVERLVDVGEWVAPGTAVFELVDTSVIEVTVDLPERHFGEVELGSPVSVLLADTETEPLVGEVTGIAPRASTTTHTFPIIVSVPNSEGRLGSGMLVRATVQLRGTFESPAVPKDAVVRQGDGTVLYTVADGKAALVPVEITARMGEMVAVSGPGIERGMPVVIRGNERIFPGSPVRVEGEGGGAPSPEGGAAEPPEGAGTPEGDDR